MERVATDAYSTREDLWQSAAWYRALTLVERIALLRENTANPLSVVSDDDTDAKQRLHRWKEQYPFNKEENSFAQRLAADELTEDELLALLAEPPESLQARADASPVWLQRLADVFSALLPAADGTPSLLAKAIADAPALAMHDILLPLIKQGIDRLKQDIQALTQHYDQLPFHPERVVALLVPHLLGLVNQRMAKTMILELNIARVQGRLQGETPEERFQDFLRQLCRPDGMPLLLQEYPVLARLLEQAVDRWLRYELELLEHLCADWDEIRAVFQLPPDVGTLIGIAWGQGDTHRGGRCVTIFSWSSGLRLVYKPRSLAIDVHFQELLSWLNNLGFRPAFRVLRVIDKRTHGWSEFVNVEGCTTREEVERFYRRQGGYLALLYALEAADFHSENLIASGEHPILIDLETLLQPRIVPETTGQQKIAGPSLDDIVLRVGMLPYRIWPFRESEGIDISGLGGQAGQRIPLPMTIWAGSGTDEMRVNREHTTLQESNHRPRLQGQDVDTLEYLDCIVNGFTAAYRLLLQHRDALLQELLLRFAHDEIRCIMRPTPIYVTLINDSFHPDVLRDALDRDRLLDRLWAGAARNPHLARLVLAEQADARAGDVPMFTTSPDSHDLFTSQGAPLAEFFTMTGMEAARKRLASFSEDDMQRQIWVIKASFACLKLGIDKPAGRLLHLRPSQAEVSYGRLLAAARAAGDHLEKLAVRGAEHAGWFGITPIGERQWQILPTDIDLYSGTSGIALFLGYLGKLTGEERYTALAQQALNNVRALVAQREVFASVGAFGGIGSVIYLLSHLGTLWHDPVLYEEAEAIVRRLPDTIAQDKMYDVMAGSAGCIAALLSLYSVFPSDAVLEMAVRCGDHLLAHARPMQRGTGWPTELADVPLTGFSHGSAGIALNLLRLSAVSGDERFRQASLAAMEYERGVFVQEQRNWPDFRKDLRKAAQEQEERGQGEQGPSCMIAWCHGAPGIGLARLASLQFVDDAAIRAEIEAALHTTLMGGFGWSHSLCHGDMGNLDLLLVAAHILPDARYKEWLQRLAASLLDSIEEQGWITGVPMGLETPGLMNGIAGIGYHWLRLAAPEQVPSVLLLAPPVR
ncbi:MAG: type 2 lantipeptide synthetase LanM family protein [Ktedonobacteraceae bacterium]|nr:type 2 lantipeptide synthetase LanM family protein [Ktedonobacteraceae bacterium]